MEHHKKFSDNLTSITPRTETSTFSAELRSNFSLDQPPCIDTSFPYSLSSFKHTNTNRSISYDVCSTVNMITVPGESSFYLSFTCEIIILLVADVSTPIGKGAKQVLDKYREQNSCLLIYVIKNIQDFYQNEDLKNSEIIIYEPSVQTEILEQILENCNKVKWLHNWFAGIDVILPLLQTNSKLNNLIITNGRGAFSRALAEYVICVMMYFEKQVGRLIENADNLKWEKFTMGQLAGKTVGFLGYGDIAKTISQMCKVFHMNCIALRRNKTGKQVENAFLDEVFDCQDTEQCSQLYNKSDFVVCSLPLTNTTKKSIGINEFLKMKKSAIFINIGRGEVLDEDSLVNALKNNIIKGAALDVFVKEPLPLNSELWKLKNVIISSHNADLTDNYSERALHIFLINLWKYIKEGKNIKHELMHTPIDKIHGY